MNIKSDNTMNWRSMLNLGYGIVLGMMVTAAGAASGQESRRQENMRLYVGTYTGSGENDSRGIYAVDFDAREGRFGTPTLAAETTNPSFLVLNQDDTRLYSVAETRTAEGPSGAALIAWTVNDDGTLVEIGRQESGGDGPCFVALGPEDQLAGVANYGGGSVALFTLDSAGAPTRTDVVQHTGESANPRRQSEPHAHSIQFTREGRQAFAADLGTDELIAYDIDGQGQMSRNEDLTFKVTPGYGPRHFAFSPDERFILVIEELANLITSLRYQDDEITKVGDYPTLPENYDGSNTTAEILFHPNGRFVYGSNRGHDSIAVFAFDKESGELNPLGHVPSGGKTPRNFRISPDGRWMVVANQESNNLVLFKIGDDGIPKSTGREISIPKPVCVKFANVSNQP